MKNIHKTDMESHEIIKEGSRIQSSAHVTDESRCVMTDNSGSRVAENLCCTVVNYRLVVVCNNIE